MFDITSSKLLILAIVALIVVGPKDLPILLRTVGKYLGIIRRHANEFRAQLDEAIREAELHELKKEFESVGNEMKSTMEEGARAIDSNVETARLGVDEALKGKEGGSASQSEPETEPKSESKSETAPPESPQLPEKTGT
jgi:sec-independent protein translocase protein TatB